jgi:hypothetical protein
VFPGLFAWLAFRPRDRFVQPSTTLTVAGWTRTIIGLIIVVSVGVSLQGKDQPELANDSVVKAQIAAGLAVPSIVLLMGMLIWLTPPTARVAARRAMWRPLATLGAFVGLAAAFFARLSLAPLWGTPPDQLGWGRGGPLAGLVPDWLVASDHVRTRCLSRRAAMVQRRRTATPCSPRPSAPG